MLLFVTEKGSEVVVIIIVFFIIILLVLGLMFLKGSGHFDVVLINGGFPAEG